MDWMCFVGGDTSKQGKTREIKGKQVKEDLKTLASIRVDFKEKRKGKQGDFLNIRIS